MNSLMNYGSDDDCEDSGEEKQPDWRDGVKGKQIPTSGGHSDANYEEVQMELSEESTDSKPEAKDSRKSRDKDTNNKTKEKRRERDHRHHRRNRRSRSRSRSRDRRRRSRSRSRSRSRKYSSTPSGTTSSKRYDSGGKSKNDTNKSETQKRNNVVVDEEHVMKKGVENDGFFMPGISGRFRDQIERRKQLWAKKETGQKVWEATTFAQDTDGKVANKFKRLMGIKGAAQTSGQGNDGLKKQEEMFSSMEAQYEVARTATHTMRGVGLGFGSYQR